MKVSWDDEIPNIWKVIKFMSQTTNQLIYIYIPFYRFFAFPLWLVNPQDSGWLYRYCIPLYIWDIYVYIYYPIFAASRCIHCPQPWPHFFKTRLIRAAAAAALGAKSSPVEMCRKTLRWKKSNGQIWKFSNIHRIISNIHRTITNIHRKITNIHQKSWFSYEYLWFSYEYWWLSYEYWWFTYEYWWFSYEYWPIFIGKSPIFIGKSSIFIGQSSIFIGQSSIFIGKSPKITNIHRKIINFHRKITIF